MEIQELKLSIPAQGISEGENVWILTPGTSGKKWKYINQTELLKIRMSPFSWLAKQPNTVKKILKFCTIIHQLNTNSIVLSWSDVHSKKPRNQVHQKMHQLPTNPYH